MNRATLGTFVLGCSLTTISIVAPGQTPYSRLQVISNSDSDAVIAEKLEQENPQQVSPERARINFARPIELGQDAVRAFPDAPAGFDSPRAGGVLGRTEVFEYDSTLTGTRRKAVVYLPPHYSVDRKYPVLYL